jgi:PTS system mannose-specific IIB component
MLNIVLTRIDDRLIHGQVITAWSKVTDANRIVIVDDEVAEEAFLVKVLKTAAPSNIKVDVFGINEASEVLKGESQGEKLVILVKTPSVVISLINAGVDIKSLNVGGMGAGVGRKKFYKNISVSQEEKEEFKGLVELGVNVSIQIVPDAKQIDVKKLLK